MIEDFRKNLPAPLAPREFNLPAPTETALANKLKIVAVEDRRLPIVSFRLAFKSGNANEPRELPGLNAMLATLLNEGTQTRTSLQIAEQVERLGASLSASAGADNTVLAASALSNYQDDILELLADVALRPIFPADELELYRANAKQGLIAQRAQPSFLADERISQVLFGDHPYAVVSATNESLDAISREKLVAFHRQNFIPNNAVLIAVGDFDAAELTAKIEKLFGAWQTGEIAQNEFPAFPAREKTEIFLIDRAGSAQSNIVLANSAFNRNHPDFFPFLVMNQVLGAGASSRLFMNLREDKDFTYGAYSSLDARRLGGAFEATAEVRSSVTGDALKEFFYELNRVRDEEIPAEELQDAKNYLTGVFPIRLETQESLTNQLLMMQMYDLPDDYLISYREKITAVIAEDAQRVAREHIAPDKTAIVIVGDENEIYETITAYADEITLFDTNGNKKERNKIMDGTATEIWNLKLSSPQGELPVTLKLNSDGGNISGTITTPMGDGTISGGTYDLKTLNATAALSAMGMNVQAQITGEINENQITGNVSTGIPGFPQLPFTGTRAG